jgi:hypothetical protein
MQWGRYIEGAMYEATLEGDAKDIYYKNSEIRSRVLRSILEADDDPEEVRARSTLHTTAKIEDVPYRQRPPQADDPDDPFGLYDKSEPPRVRAAGRYKDPADFWKSRG